MQLKPILIWNERSQPGLPNGRVDHGCGEGAECCWCNVWWLARRTGVLPDTWRRHVDKSSSFKKAHTGWREAESQEKRAFFFSFVCLIIQISLSHLLKFLMRRPELDLVRELSSAFFFILVFLMNLVNSKTLNVKVLSQILTKGIPSDEVPALTWAKCPLYSSLVQSFLFLSVNPFSVSAPRKHRVSEYSL